MKTCIKCGTTKDFKDFYKEKSRSDGLHPWCKSCQSESKKQYYEDNKEAITTRISLYRIDNRDKVLESAKNRTKKRYWSDPARYRAELRAYRKNNPHKNCASRADYRAKQIKATPSWVNFNAIADVYALASEFRISGFDVHVDHIVPLRGKNVCGLHVEQNLRVCLAFVNLQKGNKYKGELDA